MTTRIEAPLRCGNIQGHGQTVKESNMVYSTDLFPVLKLEELKANCFITPNHCWEGQGARRKNYAAYTHDGKTFGWHRITCWLAHGEPSEGDNALHSCDNRACINPDHLRWGSQKENVHDAIQRNRRRDCRGERNGRAKINSNVVKAIRAIAGTGPTNTQIAELYGISNQMVSRIILGEAWVSVENR